MEERMRILEWDWEMREREKRYRRIIIKGVKGLEEGQKTEMKVYQIFAELGVEVKVIKIRILEKGRKAGGDMILVEVSSEAERKLILENKKKGNKHDFWIEKDLTWKERKTKWKLNQIARREEAKGRRVWIGED